VIRDAYGLRWGPVERAVSAWLVAGWRAWRPILPATFRQMPQALAADRRLGVARDGRRWLLGTRALSPADSRGVARRQPPRSGRLSTGSGTGSGTGLRRG
jgi:hypothetical protein